MKIEAKPAFNMEIIFRLLPENAAWQHHRKHSGKQEIHQKRERNRKPKIKRMHLQSPFFIWSKQDSKKKQKQNGGQHKPQGLYNSAYNAMSRQHATKRTVNLENCFPLNEIFSTGSSSSFSHGRIWQ
jgi:hypothetical protein